MQARNVLYRPHLYIFLLLLLSLSLTASFQNSLKTRMKLRIKCPKIVCGSGVAESVCVGGGVEGVHVTLGEGRHGCWGMDAPEGNTMMQNLILYNVHTYDAS